MKYLWFVLGLFVYSVTAVVVGLVAFFMILFGLVWLIFLAPSTVWYQIDQRILKK